MDTVEQARKLAADLRTRINPKYANQIGCESYLNRVYAEAIEGLIAELEKVTREAHENKDKARWANAELERVTTLARGQHVELYNARLELERLKSQEPVAWIEDCKFGPGYKGIYGWADLPVGTKLYLAAGAQSIPAVTKDSIRAAGGIVHSDGNVFFTNIDQIKAMMAAPVQAVVKDSLTTQEPTPLEVRLVDTLLGQAQEPFAPDWAGYRQGKADGIAEAQERKPLPHVPQPLKDKDRK